MVVNGFHRLQDVYKRQLFGLLIAYIVVRKDFQGKKSLEFLTMLCFAVPGTVAGVSYILAFNLSLIHI